jgi:hypothetical protein
VVALLTEIATPESVIAGADDVAFEVATTTSSVRAVDTSVVATTSRASTAAIASVDSTCVGALTASRETASETLSATASGFDGGIPMRIDSVSTTSPVRRRADMAGIRDDMSDDMRDDIMLAEPTTARADTRAEDNATEV